MPRCAIRRREARDGLARGDFTGSGAAASSEQFKVKRVLRALGARAEEVAHVLRALGARAEEVAHVLRALGARTEEVAHVLRALGVRTEEVAHVLRALGVRTEEVAHVLRALGVRTKKQRFKTNTAVKLFTCAFCDSLRLDGCYETTKTCRCNLSTMARADDLRSVQRAVRLWGFADRMLVLRNQARRANPGRASGAISSLPVSPLSGAICPTGN